MKERYCALILGGLFLILGIAGFIPGLVSAPAVASNAPLDVPALALSSGYGNLLGFIPTNYLHNTVRIIVGILGIASYTSLSSAHLYNRAFAIAYALFAVMGLLPNASSMFGLMPLYGANILFNAIAAGVAAYFSFFKPSATEFTSPSH